MHLCIASPVLFVKDEGIGAASKNVTSRLHTMAPIRSFMLQQYYPRALLYRKSSLHAAVMEQHLDVPALPLHHFTSLPQKQHHATRPGHANHKTHRDFSNI